MAFICTEKIFRFFHCSQTTITSHPSNLYDAYCKLLYNTFCLILFASSTRLWITKETSAFIKVIYIHPMPFISIPLYVLIFAYHFISFSFPGLSLTCQVIFIMRQNDKEMIQADRVNASLVFQTSNHCLICSDRTIFGILLYRNIT